MERETSEGRRNGLLAALAPSDFARIEPRLTRFDLEHGKVLARPNDRVDHVYFPITGVISSIAYCEDGSVAEMATVGQEGLVDIGVILRSDIALSHQVVQVPGVALRTPLEDFRLWQRHVPGFQRVLLQYAQAFLIQVQQTVACNAVHPVEARAARWLLMCDDRSGKSGIALTQQFLGEMLGVSRGMVSTIARNFQRAGLIEYSRGVITVLQRDGLEKVSCECYRIIREAFTSRLLPFSTPPRRVIRKNEQVADLPT